MKKPPIDKHQARAIALVDEHPRMQGVTPRGRVSALVAEHLRRGGAETDVEAIVDGYLDRSAAIDAERNRYLDGLAAILRAGLGSRAA